MSLRIGLVTGEFPPMEGGVGAFTQELARALAQLGHDVHVLTARAARPADAPRKISGLSEPIVVDFGWLHPLIRKWRWPALAEVTDWALRYELDVVNVQYQAAAYHMRSPAANLLPWRLKNVTRTAVTFHDLRVPYLFPKAGRLRETAVRFMARQAHGVIVTNRADYDALHGRIPGPLAQIPIGSNISIYTPNHIELAEVRETLGLAADDILLGYFGFLNESKGADTLLRALADLGVRYHLAFIGGQTGSSDTANNAAFLDGLRALIADLQLTERVHWTGFLPDERVSTYLHAAQLLVMPYRDGASLRRGTLMAALAHGRPLVTTWPDAPTPELVDQENVWFVPVGDETAVAKAITTLTTDPTLRAQLGEKAAQVAERFAWERIAAETAVFFANL